MNARDPSPSTADVGYSSVATLGRELAEGARSSVDVVAALLARIEAVDSSASGSGLRSVLACSESALADARACDEQRARGESLPLLHGIPVLVKDNIEVVGLPASAGATSLAGRPPTADAPLVARMRAAGAIVLGSTNLSQWANIRSPRSTGGWSAMGGLTRNPWALDRSAGGSSSGSGAALSAGLAPLAVGTETDGSITCPASLNGVVGIKPGVGLVPTQGVVPVSASQDSPGPMARAVADAALLLEVLAGLDGLATAAARPPAGLRIGVARTWRTGHPATDECFDRVADRMATTGVEVRDALPVTPDAEAWQDELTVLLWEFADGLASYLPTRGDGPRTLADVIEHEARHAEVEFAHFGHEFFERALVLAEGETSVFVEARARNLRWALETCLEPAFGPPGEPGAIDVLVAPSYGPAWKSDLVLGGHPAAASPVTMAPAIAGWPIATVPMGLVAGLPVGLAAVGRPGSEAQLLSVCAAVESLVGLESSGALRPTWMAPAAG